MKVMDDEEKERFDDIAKDHVDESDGVFFFKHNLNVINKMIMSQSNDHEMASYIHNDVQNYSTIKMIF